MASRPPRLEYAGARYHVINRGNYRKELFGEESGAAEGFERALGETASKFGWRVAAYVVMRNHFHLALETPEPNLSLGMKWLQGTWARRFNGYRKLKGRPFQDRFKSLVIENGEGFRRVCDYIHLNPVRARVVKVAEVGSYRRSSLWRYLHADVAAWMDPEWLAGAIGFRNTVGGWRGYCDRLGVIMADGDEKGATHRGSAQPGLVRGKRRVSFGIAKGGRRAFGPVAERTFCRFGARPDS